MSKYIDAEKLKAEIERRMLEDYNSEDNEADEVAQGVCAGIIFFITSLQQEQPVVDLEEEIDNVMADYSFTKTIDSGGFKTTVLDYAKIARHFYELGLKAGREE